VTNNFNKPLVGTEKWQLLKSRYQRDNSIAKKSFKMRNSACPQSAKKGLTNYPAQQD
jgi:hypothetical protein